MSDFQFDWCEEHQCLRDGLYLTPDGEREFYECPHCQQEWADEMYGDNYPHGIGTPKDGDK